jgi:hypothetical protein
MVDHDDDTDEHDHDHVSPAVDPFSAALVLIDLALNPKAAKVGLKQLVKLDKDIGIAEKKFADLQSQAAAMQTALTQRAAELAAREAAISARESSFEASLREAHDHLRQYHNNLAQQDRRIRYRILSSADLLHGFNERLQELPDWPAIKQMIPGLPPDLPATPPAEVVTREVTTDWTGSHSFIAGSTLTRSVPPS